MPLLVLFSLEPVAAAPFLAFESSETKSLFSADFRLAGGQLAETGSWYRGDPDPGLRVLFLGWGGVFQHRSKAVNQGKFFKGTCLVVTQLPVPTFQGRWEPLKEKTLKTKIKISCLSLYTEKLILQVPLL